jgi:hypothetical protein
VEALSHSPKSSFHEAHLYNFNVETLRLTAVKAGFSDPRTSLSPDGGNVMLTARRPATPSERPAELSFRRENFRSIHDLVVSRSTIRHFFTRWPYVRLLGKLTRSLAEGLDAFRRGGNAGRKRLLDDLYAERLKLEPATAVSGALSGEPF